MRVIAGHYGGRQLAAPPGLDLRPSSDALRETLFNILGPGIQEAVFVDACAGTGAVGIEALSRGAAEVVFFEIARAALAVLHRNLARLGQPPAARVLRRAVPAGFALLARPADLVFLDPPYAAAEVYERCLTALGAASAPLRAGGRVIAEHARRRNLAASYGSLRRVRVVAQGDSQLSFYTA
ncbi:MAG: 16S rRNA (guanine(966)-N(2))-methyltransferase RsmD [Terriglobales bacterium]